MSNASLQGDVQPGCRRGGRGGGGGRLESVTEGEADGAEHSASSEMIGLVHSGERCGLGEGHACERRRSRVYPADV